MYFVEQIKNQFCLTITLGVGGPEGSNEAIIPQETEAPQIEITAGTALNHAKETTSNLNSAVAEQETLGLASSQVEGGEEGSANTSRDVISNFSVSEGELENARGDFPEGTSEMEIKQGILQFKLDAYHNGELPKEDMQIIETMFSDAGLEGIPSEISIDALEAGEIDDIGKDATPEQLEAAGTEVAEKVHQLDIEIASMPAGLEKEVLKKRRGLIGVLLDAIEGKTNQGGIEGSGFAGVESNGSHNVVGTAKKHLGIHENSGQADKFLMGMAQSARKTPWCAGFVSYVCKEAGYNINPTLSSKAFIGEAGKGHVAFNVGGGKMLGGNQGNEVSIKNINKPIQGWIMPEDYASGKPPQKSGNAPVGAIIVFNRGGSDKNMA